MNFISIFSTKRVLSGTCVLVISSVASIAGAESLPILKAGLWEVDAKMPQMPGGGMTQKLCVDEASQASLISSAKNAAGASCSEPEIARSGNVWTTVANCKYGPQAVTTKATMTLTDDEHYLTETDTAGGRITTIGTYRGACPADMQPGDILTSTGQKLNTKQLEDMMKKSSQMADQMNRLPANPGK